MAIDLFFDDLNRVTNDDLFSAVAEFAKAQPNEGWRLDYAVEWTDSALKNVAGFANTFGGLLIVGVRKGKRDVACELVGVESDTEYKTRIASSIAANVSPTPSYEIFECHEPTAAERRFCVVRIRSSARVHMIMKKDIEPVYIRNEDEARPADAAQLRRLIEHEQESRTNPQGASKRAALLCDSMHVFYDYSDTDSGNWYSSTLTQSPTWLKLACVPTEVVSLELDRSHEEMLRDLITEIYPCVQNLVYQGNAACADRRSADFFEFTWYHKKLKYEGRWRVTQDGGIAHATEMQYRGEPNRPLWSVFDLALYLVLFVKLMACWWKTVGYFGEGHLQAQLRVQGLQILPSRPDGYFEPIFDPTSIYSGPKVPTISAEAIEVSTPSTDSASAEGKFNYFSAKQDLARLATSVLNQLLRSLGHSVSSRKLEHDVQRIIAG